MMRKVIYLLAIISLVGCTRVDPQYSRIEIGELPTKVYPFEYKGHTYIMFRQGEYKTGTMGVVHDPDCKCRIRKYQH
jgi:hypothetical protein